MLDFYSIEDSDPDWSEPREECYVGSLSLSEWATLSKLWSLLESENLSLSYFEDTRLTVPDAQAVLEKVKEFDPPDLSTGRRTLPATTKLRVLLETAIGKGAGIIAFCD